ncbi:hypothetical protein QF048_005654 [Streptomyces sp. W4I9-2]|nr:hypothetical protein [Streptomyces sp. W4I9-2]
MRTPAAGVFGFPGTSPDLGLDLDPNPGPKCPAGLSAR